LLNAVIHNEGLRAEIFERPEFWKIIAEIEPIMKAPLNVVKEGERRRERSHIEAV
jgi:hypothetical protein